MKLQYCEVASEELDLWGPYKRALLDYLKVQSAEELVVIHGADDKEELSDNDAIFSLDWEIKEARTTDYSIGWIGFGHLVFGHIRAVGVCNASPAGFVVKLEELKEVIEG